MKPTNIRNVGRYRNTETLKEYNIKKGRKKGYDVDILYYLYRGKRIIISDMDFYSPKYVKI